MKYFSILFLLLLFCIGCIKTETEDIPEHLRGIEDLTLFPSSVTAQNDIQFNRTQVFEESEELTIGRISGIAIDESERVYISESTQGHAAIHVFDTEGSYLTSLGGYGEGPGEFRSIINPQIKDEYLFALDGRQLKINVYSSQTFSFENSIQLDGKNWSHIEELNGLFPADFTILDSSRILTSFLKPEGKHDLLYYYITNSNGEIISDKVLEQVSAEHFVRPDNRGSFFSPFSGNGLMVISEDENLYTIWTDEILIKEYSVNGEYQRSFYHPFNNKKLNRDEVLNLYENNEEYRAAVRNTGVPEYWPAIRSVILDDENQFWISTIIDDDTYEWWVLNREGKLTSQFQWPKTKEIRIVKNRSAYVLETEQDSGLQKVVKYQVQFK